MRLPRLIRRHPRPERRGAALLLTVLVLAVVIAIIYQIRSETKTDARVGQNDVGLSIMERSIESAKWDVYELLQVDGEDAAAAGEDQGAAPMAAGGEGGGDNAGPDGGGEEEAPTDSSKDEWARIQRTTINDIELRILVEAENAKYNVLNVLTEDEDEAEEAFQRVVRIIDLFREDTELDLSNREAEEMAREMRDYLLERNRGDWPQPELLTFDEEREGLFLPMSLRDFLVLESWQPHFFRCYRDSLERRVHSLDQFLTVWSSPALAEELEDEEEPGAPSDPAEDEEEDGGGSGDMPGAEGGEQEPQDQEGETAAGGTEATLGYRVNVNLAPKAVLAGLFDDRDVRLRFWDDVIEYRNLDEEEEEGGESEEPLYDQFNEEIRDKRVFESLGELEEVRSWDDYDAETRARIESMLETQSEVFTIYITARRENGGQGQLSSFADPRERERLEELPGGALVRTVRTVVWRRSGDDGVEIVPILPWEVLDYRPFELEDYPEDYY